MKTLILTMFLFSSAFSLRTFEAIQKAESGKIKGTLYDVNRAVVPSILLSLVNVSTGEHFSTRTGASGEYEFVVPQGRYTLKGLPGLIFTIGFERAVLYIKAGKTLNINSYVSGEIAVERPIVGESVAAGKLPEIITLYIIRQEKAGFAEVKVQYQNLSIQDDVYTFEGIIFTVENITVLSSKCVIKRNNNLVAFEDNVRLDDGTRFLKSDKLKLNVFSLEVLQ